MKKSKLRILATLSAILLFLSPGKTVYADVGPEEESRPTVSEEEEEARPADAPALAGEAKSVILMEAKTGKVLFEYEADRRLPPASVTKIMTVLLVVEELDRGTVKLTDTVSVSENAASMGGSQVYLKAGEQMTVDDLLKSVVVASANDASAALAEHIAGSVEGFVERMNERAKELGMSNTVFENPTGLDDSTVDHKTTARDIARMSRELLAHEMIFHYTTIWMDSIRDGSFGLTNTNRLIRFYSGANGLKTGSTSKAGFCISAAAKREGMQLIAVIMGAPNRDSRNETAKKLLDYGFANFRYYESEAGEPEPLKVLGGVSGSCRLVYGSFQAVLDKKEAAAGPEVVLNLPETLSAPVGIGDIVGSVEFKIGDRVIGSLPVCAAESVPKISYFGLLKKMFGKFFLG